ncbi:uncharacterized protein LOC108090365 [Drosophila ficusphila]|uniref:uncharacterized protein LOC108090365 n=1 Tax=Drosophila ficusphila TaxID=30025 RepID=UPI0007E62F19|nr:uncharacterized protein LOC108090365 [Drosophila ficusphila]
MSRVSVLSGLTRCVIRSTRTRKCILRCLSDRSDSPFIPQSSAEAQPKQNNLESESHQEQSGHLFVLPALKNLHDKEEIAEDCDDGITASWGWKNNELDVEQLAGLPSPSEAEDPYLKAEGEHEGDQICYTEADHSEIQEELQFERTRSLREQLNQDLDSQESFSGFERSTLTSVLENVDVMIQELSKISLLLNTLYQQKFALANEAPNQDENAMGRIYSEPKMASWALDQSRFKNKMDHEKESAESVYSAFMSDLEDVTCRNSNTANLLSKQKEFDALESPYVFADSQGVETSDPTTADLTQEIGESGQIQSVMGRLNTDPEIASSAFDQSCLEKGLDQEEESIQSVASQVTASMSDQEGLEESESFGSSMFEQGKVENVESSFVTTNSQNIEKSEPITAELAQETGESGQVESAKGRFISGPEMPSWAFVQCCLEKKLEQEESNASVESQIQEGLEDIESFGSSDITSSMVEQEKIEDVEDSVVSTDSQEIEGSEPITAELAQETEECEQLESAMGRFSSGPEMPSWAFVQSVLEKKLEQEEESNQSVESEVNTSVSDQEGLEEVESFGSSDITNSMPEQEEFELKESSFASTDSQDIEESEPVISELAPETAETQQIVCADDSHESSPSKTNEITPEKENRQEIQPEEPIHTYRPFKTIEVPVDEPSSSVSSESSEEQSPTQKASDFVGLLDNTGYRVCTKLTKSESRQLMRLALQQALDDLESGKSTYKATILEADTK